MSIALIHR